jgi:hypothetical protein
VARSGRRALRDLLLAATAAAGRDADERALADLVAAAPISALPAAAALHRVSGCVHESLRDVAGVSTVVLRALDIDRRVAARTHLRFSHALARIGDAWNDAGVSWLVMKGPALTSVLYGDPGLRSYGDLDVLLARRSLVRGVEVLEQLGYEHRIKNWPLAQWFAASEFVMFDGAIDVDVHWHLVYAHYDRRRFHIDPQVMLDRARTVVVGGRPADTFDREDTLLHLALHASRSGAHRLIWFKDIERSLAVDAPDLDELVRRARAFGCGPPVGLALGRARTLLDADVPDGLVESLLGRPLAAVERAVTAVSPPIRFDEHDTPARFVARSLRSDVRASVADIGRRSLQAVRRAVPRRPHETADEHEKAAYLDAIANGDLSR